MQEPEKSRTSKIGQPPGTLVYVGDKPVEPTVISYTLFDEKTVEEKIITTIEDIPKPAAEGSVLWVQVTGLADIQLIRQIGKRFQLHPLVLEDVLATDQRPKQESYETYDYIVARAILRKTPQRTPDEEQVSLILGPNYVISIQERQSLSFHSVHEWINHNRGSIRSRGAHYLLYSLLDLIIDQYFVFLEAFGEEIEDLETELVTEPTQNTLQTIYELKRTMIISRKAIWPLQEVVSRMERTETPAIREQTGRFLRDIYDHAIRVLETIEINREILSGMLDIYLSSLSNRTNEVMKVLTIIATIFIPLTLIAGIYGMNFPNMPEYSFPYSYPILLLAMCIISFVLIIYFRKKRWF